MKRKTTGPNLLFLPTSNRTQFLGYHKYLLDPHPPTEDAITRYCSSILLSAYPVANPKVLTGITQARETISLQSILEFEVSPSGRPYSNTKSHIHHEKVRVHITSDGVLVLFTILTSMDNLTSLPEHLPYLALYEPALS